MIEEVKKILDKGLQRCQEYAHKDWDASEVAVLILSVKATLNQLVEPKFDEMDIEKVKEILAKYRKWVLEVKSRRDQPDFNKALDAYCDLEETAGRICQLFPKSAENPDGVEPTWESSATIESDKGQTIKKELGIELE